MTAKEGLEIGKNFSKGFLFGIHSPSKKMQDTVITAEPMKGFIEGFSIGKGNIVDNNATKMQKEFSRTNRWIKARLWKRAGKRRRI